MHNENLKEFQVAMESIYDQLDSIDRQLDAAGNEVLGRIVRKMLDTFIGITNTFKTMATRFHKVVKRSELKYFKESNAFKVKAVMKYKYTGLANILMPMPRGMVSTYPEYFNIIDESLSGLKMPETSLAFYQAIKAIHDEFYVDNPNFTKQIKNASNLFDARMISNIEKRLKKVDNPKSKILEKPFGDLFKSINEFTSLYQDLLKSEERYNEIKKVIKHLDSITELLDHIIKDTERIDLLNSKDLKALSNIAYGYANTFDIYGVLLHNLQRIEHNYVECLKTIIVVKKI